MEAKETANETDQEKEALLIYLQWYEKIDPANRAATALDIFNKVNNIIRNDMDLKVIENLLCVMLMNHVEDPDPEIQKQALILYSFCAGAGLFQSVKFLELANKVLDLAYEFRITTVESEETWIRFVSIIQNLGELFDMLANTKTQRMINVLGRMLNSTVTNTNQKVTALKMLIKIINDKGVSSFTEIILYPIWQVKLLPLMFTASTHPNVRRLAIDLAKLLMPWAKFAVEHKIKIRDKLNSDILYSFIPQMDEMMKNGDSIYGELWCYLLTIVGLGLGSKSVINALLAFLQVAFRTHNHVIINEAFKAWQFLIQECRHEHLEKRLTLLIQPLTKISCIRRELRLIKYKTWRKLINEMIKKNIRDEQVFEEYFNCCFGSDSPAKIHPEFILFMSKSLLQLIAVKEHLIKKIKLDEFHPLGTSYLNGSFSKYHKILITAVADCSALLTVEEVRSNEASIINDALWKSLFTLTDQMPDEPNVYNVLRQGMVTCTENSQSSMLIPIIVENQFKIFNRDDLELSLLLPLVTALLDVHIPKYQFNGTPIIKNMFEHIRTREHFMMLLHLILSQVEICTIDATNLKMTIYHTIWKLIANEVGLIILKKSKQKEELFVLAFHFFCWPIESLHVYNNPTVVAKWKELYILYGKQNHLKQNVLAKKLLEKFSDMSYLYPASEIIAEFIYFTIINLKDISSENDSLNDCLMLFTRVFNKESSRTPCGDIYAKSLIFVTEFMRNGKYDESVMQEIIATLLQVPKLRLISEMQTIVDNILKLPSKNLYYEKIEENLVPLKGIVKFPTAMTSESLANVPNTETNDINNTNEPFLTLNEPEITPDIPNKKIFVLVNDPRGGSSIENGDKKSKVLIRKLNIDEFPKSKLEVTPDTIDKIKEIVDKTEEVSEKTTEENIVDDQTDNIGSTSDDASSTAAIGSTSDNASSTAANCSTSDKTSSTAANCSTSDNTSSTAANCSTSDNASSTAANCSTSDKTSSIAAIGSTSDNASCTAAIGSTSDNASSTADNGSTSDKASNTADNTTKSIADNTTKSIADNTTKKIADNVDSNQDIIEDACDNVFEESDTVSKDTTSKQESDHHSDDLFEDFDTICTTSSNSKDDSAEKKKSPNSKPKIRKSGLERELNQMKIDINCDEEYKNASGKRKRRCLYTELGTSSESMAKKPKVSKKKSPDKEEHQTETKVKKSPDLTLEQVKKSKSPPKKVGRPRKSKSPDTNTVKPKKSKSPETKPSQKISSPKSRTQNTLSTNTLEFNLNILKQSEIPKLVLTDVCRSKSPEHKRFNYASKSTEPNQMNSDDTQSLSRDTLNLLEVNDSEEVDVNEEKVCRKVLFDETSSTESAEPQHSPCKIQTSPIQNDTPTRNRDLYVQTLAISPIKKTTTEESEPNQPELVVSEPQTVAVLNPISSKTASPSTFRRKPVKYAGGRSARMMDLVSAKTTLETPVASSSMQQPVSENSMTVETTSKSRTGRMIETCELSQEESKVKKRKRNLIPPEQIFTFSKTLPSPLHSPSVGILRKRKKPDTEDSEEEIVPQLKKKRVNFSDPPVSCQKYIEKRRVRKPKYSIDVNDPDADDKDYKVYTQTTAASTPKMSLRSKTAVCTITSGAFEEQNDDEANVIETSPETQDSRVTPHAVSKKDKITKQKWMKIQGLVYLHVKQILVLLTKQFGLHRIEKIMDFVFSIVTQKKFLSDALFHFLIHCIWYRTPLEIAKVVSSIAPRVPSTKPTIMLTSALTNLTFLEVTGNIILKTINTEETVEIFRIKIHKMLLHKVLRTRDIKYKQILKQIENNELSKWEMLALGKVLAKKLHL